MTRAVHIAIIVAGLLGLTLATIAFDPDIRDEPEVPRIERDGGDRDRRIRPERPAAHRPAPHRRLFDGKPARRNVS